MSIDLFLPGLRIVRGTLQLLGFLLSGLLCYLVGCLVDLLPWVVGCMIGGMVAWLAGLWMVGCMAGGLVECLQLVGWLVGCLAPLHVSTSAAQ